MRILAFLTLCVTLASCGRDKGSYEIEGTFLDACTLEPLQRTKGIIYVYDRDSIDVNSLGYFHEEKSWDVELGWMQRPREHVWLESHFFDNDLQRSFFASFSMTKGYTNMGHILINAQLEIPVRFSSDTTTCTSCKWEVYLEQQNSWRISSHQRDINLSSVPGFVINFTNDTPLEWDIVYDRPQNPIILGVIEIDSAGVRSNILTLDISDQVNRCGLSDTVVVKL
jgi:hypothetical protein